MVSKIVQVIISKGWTKSTVHRASKWLRDKKLLSQPGIHKALYVTVHLSRRSQLQVLKLKLKLTAFIDSVSI